MNKSRRTIDQIIAAKEAMDQETFNHYVKGGDVLYNRGGKWQYSQVNLEMVPTTFDTYKIKMVQTKIPCIIFESGDPRVITYCKDADATHYIVLDDGEPRIEREFL